MRQQFRKKYVFGAALAVVVGLSAFFVSRPASVSAACPAVSNPIGTVTSTFTVPTTGTYRVWSRIMAPDGSNNSYTLEIDAAGTTSTCGVVVGDSAITANSWTWVDYRDGNTNSKITVNLTAGTHTLTMYGRENGVKLDRVMFLGNQSCVPDNTRNTSVNPIREPGDNCGSSQDSVGPTVSITAPANGTSASTASTVTVTATASDAGGVSSVQLKLDGTVRGNFTSTGGNNYSYSLPLSAVSAGAHTLVATATDNNQNSTDSGPITLNVTVPDTSPPTVSLTAPTTGTTVSGNVTVTANAADNVGVTKVELLVDGTVVLTDSSSPYSFSWDSSSVANGSHTLTARAFDAGNRTADSSVTVTVNNAAPLKPGDVNGDTRIDIFDLSILLSNFSRTGATRAQGDLNGDGTINIFDLSTLLSAWGT